MPTSPSSSNINLIATKTGLSPQFEIIESALKRVSMFALVIFLVVGVTVGAVYFYYSSELSRLEDSRTQLRNQINALKNIEGLLDSIKDRTKIVRNAMGSQRPLAQTLDLLAGVAVPPALSSVSIDQESKIEISISGNSLDEIAVPIETLISYANEGRVLSPELRSVQFSKNGVVMVSLSFNAVF